MIDTSTDAAPAVAGESHWAHKGNVTLFLWEKDGGSPRQNPAALFRVIT
jgi:hypothetical protein